MLLAASWFPPSDDLQLLAVIVRANRHYFPHEAILRNCSVDVPEKTLQAFRRLLSFLAVPVDLLRVHAPTPVSSANCRASTYWCFSFPAFPLAADCRA